MYKREYIITVDQMRAWEKASWDAGCSEEAVIQNVGLKIAERLFARFRRSHPYLVIAGFGHNGDDALWVAKGLEKHGCKVHLIHGRDPVEMLEKIENYRQSGTNNPPSKRTPIVVDGLFGIGLNRPLSQEWCRLITYINDNFPRIFTIDNPSGLDKTGAPSPVAITAERTYTVGAIKEMLVQSGVKRYTGELELVEDIGLLECYQTGELYTSEPTLFQKTVDYETHKGKRGHVLVLAGSLGYHGAAVLAAKAATAAMPGLVTLCTMPEVYIPVASQLQVQMVFPWDKLWQIPKTVTTILIGPGLANPSISEFFWQWVNDLWMNWEGTVVVDASALDHLPKTPRNNPNAARVITPHPGEAARLLNCKPSDIQKNRKGSLKQLTALFPNTTIVLKGHHTLVGSFNNKEIFINLCDDPGLAQGGTGDVLAGYITGTIAVPGNAPIQDRVAEAVMYHGLAAKHLSKNAVSWDAGDLISHLPATSSTQHRK